MIDSLRYRYPHLGLAVYAYTPGGPVTLEVLTPDGSTFQRTAPTMTEAAEALFGPLETNEPNQVEPEDEPNDVFS